MSNLKTKVCPVCGKIMGYDHEGSSEWYQCFNGCGHKEIIKKHYGDNLVGEYFAIDMLTNRVVQRGTENECLNYCNDRVKLCVQLMEGEYQWVNKK